MYAALLLKYSSFSSVLPFTFLDTQHLTYIIHLRSFLDGLSCFWIDSPLLFYCEFACSFRFGVFLRCQMLRQMLCPTIIAFPSLLCNSLHGYLWFMVHSLHPLSPFTGDAAHRTSINACPNANNRIINDSVLYYNKDHLSMDCITNNSNNTIVSQSAPFLGFER